MPKKIARAARQITQRQPKRDVALDPDYIADLETSDSQRSKHMADHAAGKPVKRPQPR
jgi:hypothetical protein